jgi:hypothetical protein
MTVGQQVFSAKGAQEEAAGELGRAVLSRHDDYTLRKQAAFKGFEILSRSQPAAPCPTCSSGAWEPTYTAHLNAGNPTGTMQSIEHTLRALDRVAADQQQQTAKAGQNSHRLSGPGQPALRARGAAEGIAGAPGPAQCGPRPRQKRRPGGGSDHRT